MVEIADDRWELLTSIALQNLVILTDCSVDMCSCARLDNAAGTPCFGKALAANADSVVVCGKLSLEARCFDTTEDLLDLFWSLKRPRVCRRRRRLFGDRRPSRVPTSKKNHLVSSSIVLIY